MEKQLFNNTQILAWLEYFSENTQVDLEKVKILDITRKNKNLIPTVESNDAVLVFTEAGHADIFYRMWGAGLGECDVWYNNGSEPSGPMLHDKVRDMINRGINASAAMLILNPKARSTYKIGMQNSNFSRGSIHYVGSEIRAVILNKMHIASDDTVCIVSGESIAVEAAIIAGEGTVIAVEYNQNDRRTMEENIEQFGLNNITDHRPCGRRDHEGPARAVAGVSGRLREHGAGDRMPAAPQSAHGICDLHAGFPLRGIPAEIFARYGIGETEVIQLAVSRLTGKHTFAAEPAPWLISGKA